MPDLACHLSFALLTGRLFRTRAAVCIFTAGSFLPDLAYKGLNLLSFSRQAFCEATHTPLFLAACSYACSFLFEERLRRTAFWSLWLGALSHLLLDFLKCHLGEGVVMWLYPFSLEAYEAGLFWPESAVAWTPLVLLGSLAIEFLVLRRLLGRGGKAQGLYRGLLP